MVNLSFREAAKRANVSVGAIQKAIKRGELDASLDERLVEIWKIRRLATQQSAGRAIEKVHELWSDSFGWFTGELANDPGQHVDRLLDRLVVRFVDQVLNLERQQKYIWSEEAYARNAYLYDEFKKNIDPDEEYDVEIRLIFRIFSYLSGQIRIILTQMLNIAARQGKIVEFSVDDYVIRLNLGEGQFRNFASRIADQVKN